MAKITQKEINIGVKQALGITFYCSLIGLVIYNGESIFGDMDSFVGPITFLTMFSVSALTCGLIVFKKPYELFFDGKKIEALNVVVVTALSLFAILAILFGTMILLRQ